MLLSSGLGLLSVTPIRSNAAALVLLALPAAALGFFGAGAWVLLADTCLFAVWLLVGATPVINGPVATWVRRDSLPGRPLSAVVVLSGGMSSDSTLNAASTDRLLTGLSLMRAGVAKRLVTTRVVGHLRSNRFVSDNAQHSIVHLAGLDSALVITDSVASTHDEAEQAAHLLLPAGQGDVAVVTSPMHTRRACATFEAEGFHVWCVPSRESEQSTWHPASFDDRLAAFGTYLYERLGMVKYRAKGWVRSH